MNARTQDDITIDGNAIYRHTKKMYSEKEYRQRYARLDYMQLTEKQQQVFEDDRPGQGQHLAAQRGMGGGGGRAGRGLQFGRDDVGGDRGREGHTV